MNSGNYSIKQQLIKNKNKSSSLLSSSLLSSLSSSLSLSSQSTSINKEQEQKLIKLNQENLIIMQLIVITYCLPLIGWRVKPDPGD